MYSYKGLTSKDVPSFTERRDIMFWIILWAIILITLIIFVGEILLSGFFDDRGLFHH